MQLPDQSDQNPETGSRPDTSRSQLEEKNAPAEVFQPGLRYFLHLGSVKVTDKSAEGLASSIHLPD
jgi:hypothetical protein